MSALYFYNNQPWVKEGNRLIQLPSWDEARRRFPGAEQIGLSNADFASMQTGGPALLATDSPSSPSFSLTGGSGSTAGGSSLNVGASAGGMLASLPPLVKYGALAVAGLFVAKKLKLGKK